MSIEAEFLPKNLSSHLFVIPFYYGSGSTKAKSFGSYGSGSGFVTQDLQHLLEERRIPRGE